MLHNKRCVVSSRSVRAKDGETCAFDQADAGIEVAFADSSGWDTHFNQAPQLNNLLTEFGRSLAAFHQDLGDRISDVVVITMSEFGRTAKENGTRGTDHGQANVMFAMGGGVCCGLALGKWPGLQSEQLYEAAIWP